RRAGVSAFGISGTNAHVILEEPPRDTTGGAATAPPASGPLLYPISAKTPEALRAQAQRLHDHVLADPASDLAAVAFALATGRSHFAHRTVAIAADRAELVAALDRIANGEPDSPAAEATDTRRPVFVFPGQGSQWAGMARDLLATSTVFRRSID